MLAGEANSVVLEVLRRSADLNGAIWVDLYPPVPIRTENALRFAENARPEDVITPLAVLDTRFLEAIEEDIFSYGYTILQLGAVEFQALVIVVGVDEVTIVVLLVGLPSDPFRSILTVAQQHPTRQVTLLCEVYEDEVTRV